MNDITYWNNFYCDMSLTSEPSDFCKFILKYFENHEDIQNVIDCGSGNGRDSYALSKKYNVHGVDNSGYIPDARNNVFFSSDNFITIDKEKYDLVYSRFTFHSITNEDQITFLQSIPSKKYLTIETHAKDGEDDYVHHGKTHFRNYTDIDYLKSMLLEHNFDIIYVSKGNNMAKYKDENPICIRVVCKKN